MTNDFILINQGTISTLTPVTEGAKDWIDEHIPDDAQWFGRSLVIEWRYVEDIYNGILGDGLTVGG